MDMGGGDEDPGDEVLSVCPAEHQAGAGGLNCLYFSPPRLRNYGEGIHHKLGVVSAGTCKFVVR